MPSPVTPLMRQRDMVEPRTRDVRLDLGAFDPYDSRPASPTSPDNVDMHSPLLYGWNRSPPPSPTLSPSSRAAHRPRRFALRPRRLAALLALALTATILLVQSREHAVVRQARGHAARLAQRLGEQRCKYVPGLAKCADPFRQLRFDADAGELLYPAASGSASVQAQPHPIHYLIREAEASWQDKVARQSRTLAEAVAEYKRRYRQPPPRGFDVWFAFAKKNDVQLLDEYDSIHSRLRPFAAIRPEVLRERDAILQNVSQWDAGQTFWMHPLTVTIKVADEGRLVEAEGPMRHANNRADQLMALLDGISQFLPDLNMTITGHDVPWVVMTGEHKQMLVDAADEGQCASPSLSLELLPLLPSESLSLTLSMLVQTSMTPRPSRRTGTSTAGRCRARRARRSAPPAPSSTASTGSGPPKRASSASTTPRRWTSATTPRTRRCTASPPGASLSPFLLGSSAH
mgnify:CR=1 FL=1